MTEPVEFKTDRLQLNYQDNVWQIQPLTRLDLTFSDEFMRDVNHYMAENPSDAVCNMSKVPYMSSSGIKALLNIQHFLKLRRFQFVLFGLTPEVKKIIELSELSHVFTIAADEQEALSLITSN